MRYSGRKWNNILIFSVIAFIIILNLPTLIKTYLIPPDQQFHISNTLFNANDTVTAVYSADWALEKKQGFWTLTPTLAISATTLYEHWHGLEGTPVNEETYQSLSKKLPPAQTLEIWYKEQEEPQRVTFYQMPTFWLFKNWQNRWIAVSVDKNYLFPQQVK
ncbi:hypothetical protein LRQ06_07395 [Vibrio sp. DNF-1]|nr:hypothetical protein [Vibrio salinus]MCE0493740.1 hypothetical protein [Vibrio salinus]